MNAPNRLASLRVNPDWAKLPLFDRSRWKPVRFGDVVRVLREEVDPASGEVDRYVAGEHMDSESIHIRRWGTVGDGYLGPAFHRGFRKGQVLYGSRRTYLKKVAVAEWDGVTANTTFVLETNRDRMLQELLPWLMLSERFTKHSIQESKGSTNPYINWPDIAKFEFDLPPLEQQDRCAAILSAADNLIEEYLSARKNLAATADEVASTDFRGADVSDVDRSGSLRLGDVFKVVTGGTPPRSNADYWKGSIPWVKTGEVNYNDITDTEEKISDAAVKNSAAKLVPPDSILIAMYGQGPTLGRVAHLRISATTNQACAAICPSPKMHARYLYHYLARQYSNIRKLARGASQPNINLQIVKDLRLPSASLEEQRDVASQLDSFVDLQKSFGRHIERTRQQMLSFSNALFT
jgi:type I restriction enzyme S subunit